MPRHTRPSPVALVGAGTLLLAAATLWADLTPAQVADVAPLGAPDGTVDSADVDLVLRAAAGDATLDDASLERADVAPVDALSPESDPPPQRVRPNGNPDGPVDIGDAVVVARRAAGLIVFDRVNQAPKVTLPGHGDVTSVPRYEVRGRVTDDLPIEDGFVELRHGTSVQPVVDITADVVLGLEGSFTAYVTLEPGPNDIVVRARDLDARFGPPVTMRVTLDQKAPALAVTSPLDGFLTGSTTVEVSGTASDESGVVVTVDDVEALLLPPNLWGATVDLPFENVNTLVVVARDRAVPPNEVTKTLAVIRDTTRPQLSVDPVPEAVSTRFLALGGEVRDAWGIDSVTVGGVPATVTWEASAGRGRWSALVPVLEGANEYDVVAVDRAGNRTTATPVGVLGDFVPPEVRLTSPSFVRASPTAVSLSFSEPVLVERVGARVFDPPVEAAAAYTATGIALVEGPNAVAVRVRDPAGNTTQTSFSITLDTRPPVVTITKVSNAAFRWVPAGGLDGVTTNAPSATVEGTVTDAIGVASVRLNGFDATVDGAAGTFVIAGVPLVPRANTLTATASDQAGNTASHAIVVKRDAEGPAIALDFARAAYVSTRSPAPAPFNATPLPARHYRGTSDIVVTGAATDPYYTARAESLVVRLDGAAVPVSGVAPFAGFSFTLPASVLRNAGLHLLEIESVDSMGNQTLDVQAMLNGEWVAPNAAILNALGLAVGPDALDAIAPLLESQVAGMNGDIADQTTNLGGGISMTIYGLAFCVPPGNPSKPPYPCTPVVNVDLSLTAAGHVAIRISIPNLYVGIRTEFSGWGWRLLGCAYARDGYMKATPAVITLEADFVNTATGVKLQERAGTVDVSIENLDLHTNHGCANNLLDLMSFILGGLENTVESLFAGQISSLLAGVNDALAKPLLEDSDTGRALKIARASNDASAVRLWLDGKGNPCPGASAKTNLDNPATTDPNDKKPCPADSPRLSPGSYAGTPNADAASLPNLDLRAPDGTAVSAEIGANDDFVNYILHEQWAMGALDMTIDQSFLGADSPVSLDTDALSLFMPDLKRADVVAQVPLGSGVAIQTAMPLPPIVSGRVVTPPAYLLSIGEMTWRFLADADGIAANGYEKLLFTAAVSINAQAQLRIVPAATDVEDDVLVVDLGTPVVSTDVTGNPLVLGEASVRAAINTLVNLALPQLTGSLAKVALPQNTARFSSARLEAPARDFLVLSGALVQTITLTSPASGVSVTTDPVTIAGTVDGLTNSAGARVALWLPGDTTGRTVTITARPDVNSLAFSTTIPISLLKTGENDARLVATDANGKKAALTFTLTRAASGVTRSGGSGCGGGCDGAGGGDGALASLLSLSLALGLLRRRRVRFGANARVLAAAALAASLSACSCGEDPAKELVFHGPAVAKDPVFLISELQIGGEGDGFNVDEDSPDGDPDPDNALQILGPLANESLAEAVQEGKVLLLVQFRGLKNLPAPGESGRLEAVAFLGFDTDKDPSDNFSGKETFAKDPSSFGADGKPLIVFKDTLLSAAADGTVTMKAGPSTFSLAIPLQDTMLELKIAPTYIEAILGISSLRPDGIEATSGMLGGVLPAAPLATEIEGLPFSPIVLLASEIDVDLDGDGRLDQTPAATNKDGLSAGILFSAVPAYLTDEPVNRPPVVTLAPVPEQVTAPRLAATGTLRDPDGDCTRNTLEVTVNGLEPVSAAITKAGDGCTFTAEVRLVVGRNAIRATATDPKGDSAYAEVVTRLDDEEPPRVALTGPTGHVTSAGQTVTGTATDDIGILAVQLDVGGTLVVVPGEEVAADGSFSVPVTLPGLGANVITAVAKDLGDNVSDPASLEVTLDDVDAPEVTFTAASSERERVEGSAPWVLSRPDVRIEGNIADNAGRDGLTVTWSVGGHPVPLEFDRETGAFERALTLPRGTHVVRVVAVDASGNEEVAEATLTIADLAGPTVLVEAPEALTRVALQELVLRVSDDWDAAELLEVAAALNGEAASAVPFDAASGAFRRPIVLVVGSNPLVIEARDPAGNVTRIEGAIELVDEEPPVLEVSAPEDGSWTIADRISVTGRATDNIGLPQVAVDNDGLGSSGVAAADGAFALEVPLRMGANVLTIGATDTAGLVTQQVRRVERRDPNEPATVELVANPGSVAVGNDTLVTLTATITRLAGGPVPDGTTVLFRANPPNLGVLEGAVGMTTGGVASARFVSGREAGLVTFTAEARPVTDTASLTIAMPTALAVDVCLAEDARLAGASFELGVAATAAFTPRAPATDAARGLGPAQAFHAYNRAAVPTTVLLAGTQSLTGAAGGTPLARLTWPLASGFASRADLTLKNARRSDEAGMTSDASSAISVCALEHLLGTLPPRVALAPLPSPTAVASHLVTGTVEAADLAGCSAQLILNGNAIPVDVSTGTISQRVTLAAGPNVIRLLVTDAEGRQGTDELQVTHNAPNTAPQVAITAPGAAVTTTNVTVEGTVGDADDGLTGLSVAVRVGTGAPVNATIDATAGTFRASVTLQSGSNTLTVTATDARGASTVVSQPTQVVAAVAPPRVTITAPTEGQVVSTSTVTLSGRVDDGGNPATIRVTLTVNGTSQPITFSPFSRELAATITLLGGTNVLVVTATDLTGQSGVVTRRVDYALPDSPPRVTITSPAAGVKLATRRVTVRGTVRDDRSLVLLRSLTVNGVAATVDTTSGDWSATVTLPKGSNTLVAEALDERNQSGKASVTIEVFDPIVVVNYLQIGGPADGFNVDSTPPHPLSDAAPDNALSGLASIANGPLQEQIDGTGGDPLILLFELVGLTQLPAVGQSVTVDLVGYIGVDADGNPADNFSGNETFGIDPASFDVQTGLPVIQFPRVVITNDFGVLRFNTFPANPASFKLSVSSTTPPLELKTEPAFLRATISLGADGLRFNPGLLGGVVPASSLTVPITSGDLSIVPLSLLISSDPANPVPDCDLNGDGTVNTTDATSTNPDGVSVGIVFTAVPAGVTR